MPTELGEQRIQSKRILFVDDECSIRATLPVILARYGFTVSVAANVPEALEQIRKQQFDILLCDLNVEGEKTGFQVVRAMRAIDPDCVVLMLTGYPDMESAIEGIRHSVDDYIIKPANTDELLASLASTLAKRQAKAKNYFPH